MRHHIVALTTLQTTVCCCTINPLTLAPTITWPQWIKNIVLACQVASSAALFADKKRPFPKTVPRPSKTTYLCRMSKTFCVQSKNNKNAILCNDLILVQTKQSAMSSVRTQWQLRQLRKLSLRRMRRFSVRQLRRGSPEDEIHHQP